MGHFPTRALKLEWTRCIRCLCGSEKAVHHVRRPIDSVGESTGRCQGTGFDEARDATGRDLGEIGSRKREGVVVGGRSRSGLQAGRIDWQAISSGSVGSKRSILQRVSRLN